MLERMTKKPQPTDHLSDRVAQLCTSTKSVSGLLAEDPGLAPGDAWKRLYSKSAVKHTDDSSQTSEDGDHEPGPGSLPQDELERAASCGNWGPTRPSELFLRVCRSGGF